MPGSVIAHRCQQLAEAIPASERPRCWGGAVAQEVGQADVVVQRDAEAEAAHARELGLLADHQVQAEVIGARTAVGLGYGHRQEAPAPGEREDLARDDAGPLPSP